MTYLSRIYCNFEMQPTFTGIGLYCPYEKGRIEWSKNKGQCKECGSVFPIVNDIPLFLPDDNYDPITDYYISLKSEFNMKLARNYRKNLKWLWSRYGIQGTRLLDAGCSHGYIGYAAEENFKEVWGIDLSFESCFIARNMTRSKIVQGSILNLPFENEFFDTIIGFAVMEHIPDVGSALSEFARVLKPGGKLLLYLPHRSQKYARLIDKMFLGRIPSIRRYLTEHITIHSPQEWANLVANAGFRDTQFVGQTCWPPIWWIPFLDRLVEVLNMPGLKQIDRLICNSPIVTEFLSLAFYLCATRI